MCYPPGARPPDVPIDLLPPITGGAGGEDLILTSADGTKLRVGGARRWLERLSGAALIGLGLRLAFERR